MHWSIRRYDKPLKKRLYFMSYIKNESQFESLCTETGSELCFYMTLAEIERDIN